MCHFDFEERSRAAAARHHTDVRCNTQFGGRSLFRLSPRIQRVAATMTSKSTCDIDDGVRTSLKEFRFRKSQKNAALILKVDRPKQTICLDEIIEDVEIEELQERIPSHEPRYIVYSYKMTHDDGRISYPMCFIFYTPPGIQMELQVVYASMKLVLQKEAELTRCYEVRELEELTEEWLREKLSR